MMEEKNERRSNWGSVFGNVPSVQRVNVGDIIKTNRYKYYNGKREVHVISNERTRSKVQKSMQVDLK
jgi:hypothetical protein